jgi:nucleotide-binding universal stress UspA family protein
MTAAAVLNEELDFLSTAPETKTLNIIVASDGSDAAISAFKAASLVKSRGAAMIHVLSVLEPMPPMFPSIEGFIVTPELDRSREEAQRTIVTDQMMAFDPASEWTLDVRMGRPAETIVEYAVEQQADLIIVGLNRHGFVGRVLGEETAMGIARLSPIPLLVASPTMKRLPHRAMVAMDIRPDGLSGAPEALAMIADTPSISCVHVKPRSELLGVDWAAFDNEYELAMRDRFSLLEKEFCRVNLRPDLIVLHGDVSQEITDFAAYSKAELIVIGIRRRHGRTRALSGRMATRIIRHAECSVLVVPTLTPRARVADASTVVMTDSDKWSEMLRGFTFRNSGRIASLEVDDPDIGALIEATNYPFIGADYDHKDKRLTLSLGHTHGSDGHLTRTIGNPANVAILSIAGGDTALSVSHDGGQTLLKF